MAGRFAIGRCQLRAVMPRGLADEKSLVAAASAQIPCFADVQDSEHVNDHDDYHDICPIFLMNRHDHWLCLPKLETH